MNRQKAGQSDFLSSLGRGGIFFEFSNIDLMVASCLLVSAIRSSWYCSRSSSRSLAWSRRTCLNSASSEVDEVMVSVMLLTGADVATEGVDTFIVDGRVVLDDEDDDEDGFDSEGGPAPAAVSRDGEMGC